MRAETIGNPTVLIVARIAAALDIEADAVLRDPAQQAEGAAHTGSP